MQRRLTLALVSLTLFAVVLVGAGVLTFARIGARQETEDQVIRELDAFVDLSGTIPSLDQLGPIIRRFGLAFDIGDLNIVSVDSAGQVIATRRDPGRSNPEQPDVDFTFDREELASFQTSEPLLLDRTQSGRSSVIGIQLLDVELPPGSKTDRQVAVLISHDIATIPAQAQRWFLLSAGLVLLTSVLVANQLAHRFVAPIRRIEGATTKIAAGDLAVRVEVQGTDEVADLGRSVNRMAEDLERSRQLDQQFLLSVSHDLRTPLTSINGYAEALIDGAMTDSVQAGTIIQNHAGRLNRLVSDLLDLAKLDARQFRVEQQPVDALAVVTRSVDGLLPSASNHELSLRVAGESGLIIDVDADRLAQVLANLIENAIKYANNTITVEVVSDHPDGLSTKFTEISVSDDGPGIAKQDIPHIFDRLYVTAHKPRREENSSGLGLAIVRDLTHAMGGTVDPAASDSGGTRMTVRFPTSQQELGETKPEGNG